MKKGILLLCVLLAFNNLSAQLCNGSLGDPIINITFGAGSNPGAPLKAGVTNYIYATDDCPKDGSYTIRNNTSNCFDQTWHSLTKDHTGDPNGYMMLVNASYEKGDFYLDTIHGLCGNTTYEFASWIVNLNSAIACASNPAGPIQPNLTFSIESTAGAVLQQYNTGDIPRNTSAPEWKQYGFFFKTPASTFDVVIRLTNNAPGGCGNDLALDDITFRPCGPLITPSIEGSSDNKRDICLGQTQAVTFNTQVSSGFNNPYFQWQSSKDGITWTDIPGANNQSYTETFLPNAQSGDYYYRIAAAETGNYGVSNCRIVSATLLLHAHPKPVTSADNNGPVCRGASVNLTATGGNNYVWSGNNFTASGSTVTINNFQQEQAGKYKVIVTDANGCSATDSTEILMNPSPDASVSFTDTGICRGNNVMLNAYGGNQYLWSPSAGLSSSNVSDPNASPNVTAKYQVVVYNQFNCTDTAFVNVNVIETPTVNAGSDKLMLENTSLTLDPLITGENLSYKWNPATFLDNSSIKNPTVSGLPDTITYTIIATNVLGCAASDDIKITIIKKMIIPNTFTPNNDGINDKWVISGLETYNTSKVKVVNRYGQVVYESVGYNTPWDGRYKGKDLPFGTYYYIIEPAAGIKALTGFITLYK